MSKDPILVDFGNGASASPQWASVFDGADKPIIMTETQKQELLGAGGPAGDFLFIRGTHDFYSYTAEYIVGGEPGATFTISQDGVGDITVTADNPVFSEGDFDITFLASTATTQTRTQSQPPFYYNSPNEILIKRNFFGDSIVFWQFWIKFEFNLNWSMA